jgi:2-oxoglutarate ferredoxin oxidoreductase subunit alpha
MSTTVDPNIDDRVLDRLVIRFAGDSGDGMQLTGDRFTSASAMLGNDLVTLPEYPAEIRAPAGTVAGVSAFQVHISDHDITTPGDVPDVLVAMNPAALLSELPKLEPGATVILNVDAFDERNIAKAGYDHDPLEGDDLKAFTRIDIPMTSLTKEACEPLGVKPRDAERSKNFFALGVISWMYSRPVAPTLDWIEEKFGSKPQVRDDRVVRPALPHRAGGTEAGSVYVHQWQHRHRVGPHRRVVPGQGPVVPRFVPDHSGLGHPP